MSLLIAMDFLNREDSPNRPSEQFGESLELLCYAFFTSSMWYWSVGVTWNPVTFLFHA